MKPRSRIVVLVIVASTSAQAAAQQEITLQLPTFNMTTVRTAVSVPDGGTGLLGGIGRASTGSVTRGVPVLSKVPGANRVFTNRGIGQDFGLSQMSVTPRIIILEEEELRQTGVSAGMLSQQHSGPSPLRPQRADRGIDPAIAQRADFIARHIARHPTEAPEQIAGPAPPSVEQVRQQNDLARRQRASEAEAFFAKGRRAEAEGKSGVAKIWYEMTARRAEGELLEQVIERLAILAGPTGGDRLAGR